MSFLPHEIKFRVHWILLFLRWLGHQLNKGLHIYPGNFVEFFSASITITRKRPQIVESFLANSEYQGQQTQYHSSDPSSLDQYSLLNVKQWTWNWNLNRKSQLQAYRLDSIFTFWIFPMGDRWLLIFSIWIWNALYYAPKNTAKSQ